MARRAAIGWKPHAGGNFNTESPPLPTPRLALSIPEFCKAHGISDGFFYKLKKQGEGPREMKVGARTLISFESAAEWRRAREGQAIPHQNQQPNVSLTPRARDFKTRTKRQVSNPARSNDSGRPARAGSPTHRPDDGNDHQSTNANQQEQAAKAKRVSEKARI
jgi:predicted DNA-binding transcriptional regulator AlpA